MNENERMAELLLPNITKTPDYYEELYKPRNLPEGARVTRVAPSPTGYLHLGTLFTALVNRITATSSGGIFYTRIEDTDKKREVEGGIDDIIGGLDRFGIKIDEGFISGDKQTGDYAPYKQSERAEIYQTYAKSLIKQGLAYPCFCTADELSAMREEQENSDALIRGYFGKWAKCRNLTLDEIKQNLADGKPWTLRFRSDGSDDKKVIFDDIIRGKIEMPENTIDEVLLKSDGIPTYHFAHVCDDHFMRTTHVIRGEEWISSTPKHIALFKACGYKVPKYAHTPQVMKLDEDDGNKRKLSKRKDPEAAVSYFVEKGIPKESLIEYLLTLLNSNFEDWRRANPDSDAFSFPFNLKKMSSSGCLFDLIKLTDISKNIISKMNGETVLERTLEWAETYDKERAYALGILSIDRDCPKPRKDIAMWSQVKDYIPYFYDELYTPEYFLPGSVTSEDAKAIIDKYIEIYDENDDKDAWFAKIKDMCAPLGFTPNVKEYKKNPELFKGHVGDVSSVIRVAVTSRTNTPDLCSIMKLLSRDKVIKRLKTFREEI